MKMKFDFKINHELDAGRIKVASASDSRISAELRERRTKSREQETVKFSPYSGASASTRTVTTSVSWYCRWRTELA